MLMFICAHGMYRYPYTHLLGGRVLRSNIYRNTLQNAIVINSAGDREKW